MAQDIGAQPLLAAGRAAPSRLWNGWISRMLQRTERQSDEQESAGTEMGTSLCNLRALLVRGEELRARCRRQGRGFSLVVFDCSDLTVVREIYGSTTSTRLAEHIARKLAVLARRHGVVARTAPTQFCVAIPVAREKVMQGMVRALGSPITIEFDLEGSEILLVPNFVIGTVPESSSIEQVHATLCQKLARLAQEEQRRQSYLQRKRESYSRPAPLEALDDHGPMLVDSMRFRPQIPPTMPVPLGSR